MNHYVLVFDRAVGRLLSEKEYQNSREAMRERFAAESMHRGDTNIEIVVLGAESPAALRRTHSRYFSSVSALAREGVTRVRATARAANC